MSSKTNDDSSNKDELEAASLTTGLPKSFQPQIRDPDSPNAWDKLEALSARAAERNFPIDDVFALARQDIVARELRGRHLPSTMFGEPAWDMLLSLYVTFRSHARQTVTNLCIASGAPATTALRWIVYLEREEFVVRRNNPLDLRVVFIELTAKGRDSVEGYFIELLDKKNRESVARLRDSPQAATSNGVIPPLR